MKTNENRKTEVAKLSELSSKAVPPPASGNRTVMSSSGPSGGAGGVNGLVRHAAESDGTGGPGAGAIEAGGSLKMLELFRRRADELEGQIQSLVAVGRIAYIKTGVRRRTVIGGPLAALVFTRSEYLKAIHQLTMVKMRMA